MIREEAPARESDVLQRALARLRELLPPGWEVAVRWQAEPPGDAGFDALLDLQAPDGTATTASVEVKRVVATRDVPIELERLRERLAGANLADATPVLVARYLAPTTQAKIAAAGASYLDATGNLRIVSDHPPLLVVGRGADRDPWRGPGRPRGSLRGAPAARVVRALADYAPPYTVPELIDRSGASTGATYRVVKFLEEEALLEREPRGPVTRVAWRELLERWSRDYGFDRAAVVQSFLEPRGVERTLGALRETDSLEYVITGSVAAQFDAPYAPPRLLMLYVTDLDRAADLLDLRPVDQGTNVLVAANEDPFPFDRARHLDGLEVAAPSQVAVDLLSGPGRSSAEAEALLDWMEDNEHVWRR